MSLIPLTMVLVTAFIVIVPVAMLALVLAPEQLSRTARKVRRSVDVPVALPARATAQSAPARRAA